MFCSFLFFLLSFFRFLICEPVSIMFKLLNLEILLSELCFDLHLSRLSGQELLFEICMGYSRRKDLTLLLLLCHG
jgi:hypothetical protein